MKMTACLNGKEVDVIEQLAVISALRKCAAEHDQFDNVPKLIEQLLEADTKIHRILTEFIAAYRCLTSFCEEIEAEGNGGKQTITQKAEYNQLRDKCEKCRVAFIQMLNNDFKEPNK